MTNLNKQPHYNAHPSGVECIEIAQHMGFNLGNALKYLYRYNEKGNPVADLVKSIYYLKKEQDTLTDFGNQIDLTLVQRVLNSESIVLRRRAIELICSPNRSTHAQYVAEIGKAINCVEALLEGEE